MCYECGYKKMPTQWQEIHMLICSLYQSLLHKAVLTQNTFEEANIGNHKEFCDWF